MSTDEIMTFPSRTTPCPFLQTVNPVSATPSTIAIADGITITFSLSILLSLPPFFQCNSSNHALWPHRYRSRHTDNYQYPLLHPHHPSFHHSISTLHPLPSLSTASISIGLLPHILPLLPPALSPLSSTVPIGSILLIIAHQLTASRHQMVLFQISTTKPVAC